MTGRMRWDRARYAGRRTWDWRREAELEDAASRWLKRAQSRPQERRVVKIHQRNIATAAQSSDWITAASSAEVPW